MDAVSSTTSSANAPLGHLVDFIGKTYGSVLLGTYLSLILYGGLLHQTYRYFGAYPDDKIGIRIIVSVTVLLETVHTAVSTYICLDISNLRELNLRFFAHRAYVFGNQYRPWMRLVVVLLFLAFGFSLGSTFVGYLRPSHYIGISGIRAPWLDPCATALPVFADIIMTTVLIRALHLSRSGIKSTDSLLDRVILYTVTTGLLTSGCMILLFVTELVFPGGLLYAGVSFVSIKLYTNSLLAALNTRQSLRDAAFHPSGIKVFGSGFGACAEEARSLPGLAPGGANAVTVELAEMGVSREDGNA
ncbi:hypothetical protein DICSQDRAFT_184061 [Dichomitus squalens LYAD-421 SS1]|uniref:DUF6534 domain-containing protein n=1 Tax=Dichomitus squalens (strain LYAD-421) TaxID=732165 RepID=R7SJC3_DICSQ|nr:uncharacterized protein DICSQDRAFT_184061 [Dichomitus squalens LYAD-421 SS1]EJF55978.1 hypothetical protein DICSQDRAFT_184061 [Dichomitus squalens LYAD-421 SS1]